MIGGILPAVAVTVEAGPADWTAPLHPEEEALVARADDRRRREFMAGRSCARRALERLGWPGGPIVTGPQREPLWPPGGIGSITHCSGYCAATVATGTALRGIGIDAEVRTSLDDGVAQIVCTASERRWIDTQPDDPWRVLIFSAKEAIYKIWYPLMGRWLDYQDAEVTIDVPRLRFEARIMQAVHPDQFPLTLKGRFAIDSERIYTAITLPAE